MLKNPVYYVGQTVWGKNSHGKNAWYVGGQYVIPPKKKGKTTTGRKNSVEDWVFPSHGTALIERDLFDQVQARLNGRPEQKRGLRDERLWLAGLVVCDRCGQKMSGWSQGGLSYYCVTYSKFGKSNPTGCRLHRASHDVIESFVERYLDELGIEVKALMECSNQPSLIRHLQNRFNEHASEFMAAVQEIRVFLEFCGHSTYQVGYPALFALYNEVYAHQYTKLEVAHREAREELRTLLTNLNGINPDQTEAVAIQRELIAEADRKVKELKDRLVPLNDRLDAACEATILLEKAIAEAQTAMPSDDARRKALSLRKVIWQIRLTFRHYEHRCRDRRAKGKTVPRSSLEKITMIPVQDGPASFAVGEQALTVDNPLARG